MYKTYTLLIYTGKNNTKVRQIKSNAKAGEEA